MDKGFPANTEWIRIECHECSGEFDIDADTFDNLMVIGCPHCKKDLLRSSVQWRYVELLSFPSVTIWNVV